MNNQELRRKIAAYVGFAIKSGGVSYGLEQLKSLLTRSKPALVLTDNALSVKTKKEVAFFAAKKNVPVVCLDELGSIANRPNVKIMSITDKGLAAQILENASKLKTEEKEETVKSDNVESNENDI
jgi:ribosomal protein L7Ae-like RNA K-turn-binding protein